MNMNKTYEDLENELIEFLDPIKPALPQFSHEVFDQVLIDAIDMVVPEDSDTIIQVAKSHPGMCIATDEVDIYGNFYLTHIIRDTISLKLHKCGWGWYEKEKFKAETKRLKKFFGIES